MCAPGLGVMFLQAHLPSVGTRPMVAMARLNLSNSSSAEWLGILGGSWKLLISVEQSSNLGRKSVNFSWRFAAKMRPEKETVNVFPMTQEMSESKTDCLAKRILFR